MRRKPRIDLGQQVNSKEESRLERQRERWAARNQNRPASENPFLAAVKPDHDNYGDPTEKGDELKNRLQNLEFGNFPGYFNYRKRAAPQEPAEETRQQQEASNCDKTDNELTADQSSTPLEAGLSDERLKSMRCEWFANKDVLDIGCNRGHITYAIARMFSPKCILGIDIDLRMISMANRDLHLHLEDCLLKKGEQFRRQHAARLKAVNPDIQSYEEHLNHFPLSNYVSSGPVATEFEQYEQATSPLGFPNNILFMEHNYVLARDELVDKQQSFFDTILCLSVTKWVHLNYRDEGLKRFFKRMHKHLKPGGLLILEAQPFDNYGRRKKLSDRLRTNYHSIQFKPDKFNDYLLSSEVGFKEILYTATTDHKCQGFKRPLTVFLK